MLLACAVGWSSRVTVVGSARCDALSSFGRSFGAVSSIGSRRGRTANRRGALPPHVTATDRPCRASAVMLS